MLNYVQELLDQEDNIIDQLKLLKEHASNTEVDFYIKASLTRGCPYTKSCIYKYYYGIDVKEVEPSIQKLGNIFFQELADVQKKLSDNIQRQLISDVVEVGDHVMVMDGPFATVDGVVKEVRDKHFIIMVCLLDELIDIEANVVMLIEKA